MAGYRGSARRTPCGIRDHKAPVCLPDPWGRSGRGQRSGDPHFLISKAPPPANARKVLGGIVSGAVSGAGEGRQAGSPRRGCEAAPEPESDSIKAATGCGPSWPRQAAHQPLGQAGREAPGRLRSEFKALCFFTCFLQFRDTSEELTCHCSSHRPISAGKQRRARVGRSSRWLERRDGSIP